MKSFIGFVVVLATAVATAAAVQDVVQLHPSVGAKSEFRRFGIFNEAAEANVAKGIDINDDDNDSKENNSRDESDTWMIIGVVVGAAVVLAVVGFAGVMMYRRRSQKGAVVANSGGNTRFATGPPQSSVAFSHQSPAPIIVVKPAPPTEYPETFVSDKKVPKDHFDSAHSDSGEPQPHSSNQRHFESREPAYNPEYVELQPIDHSSMVEVDLQEPPPAYDEIAKTDNSRDWTYELYVDPDKKPERY